MFLLALLLDVCREENHTANKIFVPVSDTASILCQLVIHVITMSATYV